MIVKTEFFKKSGIYCIMNSKNRKQYIGSSKNIWQRLQCHRSYLRKNKHFNEHLQNAWNKYGEDTFICFVLEFCDSNLLEEREQFYLDNLKPSYNSVLNVKRPIISEYSRKKLSDTRKKLFENGTLHSNSSKKIFQYSLDGSFIKEYNTIKEASLSNNISQSTIHRFLNGEYKKGGNFLWSYDYKEFLTPYKRIHKKNYRVKIEVRDYISNDLVMLFETIDDCAKYFNTIRPCIHQAVIEKSKFRKIYRLYKIP